MKAEDNPPYPDLGATVAKFRAKANRVGGIAKMLPDDRRAYADAIEKSIRTKQRAALMREATPLGTPQYPVGEALRRAHRARAIAAAAQERAARTPEEWQEMYAEAMEEKRQQRRLQAAE